jgi:hypothetical protein
MLTNFLWGTLCRYNSQSSCFFFCRFYLFNGLIHVFLVSQDCKEFIVPFQRVLQIATENGLRICQFRSSSGSSDSTPLALSMGSWISDCCLSCDSMSSLRRVMGVTGDEAGRSLSTEEWEAISLYMCAVWVKV